MKCYAGLSFYTKSAITELLQIPNIEGVILGDFFCQSRMFEHGIFDIHKSSELLKKAGKQVILQAPMYLTNDRLRQWVQLIDCLISSDMLDAVLLQDIGLLHTLKQKYPNIQLCWSQMGKARGSQLNAPFVKLLRQLGVCAMEIDNTVRAETVSGMGLYVWQVYGSLSYSTFWRECYSCYQLDLQVELCGQACRKMLTLVAGDLELSVDGHILDERIVYKPEAALLWPFSQRHVIYANDIESLKEVADI